MNLFDCAFSLFLIWRWVLPTKLYKHPFICYTQSTKRKPLKEFWSEGCGNRPQRFTYYSRNTNIVGSVSLWCTSCNFLQRKLLDSSSKVNYARDLLFMQRWTGHRVTPPPHHIHWAQCSAPSQTQRGWKSISGSVTYQYKHWNYIQL